MDGEGVEGNLASSGTKARMLEVEGKRMGGRHSIELTGDRSLNVTIGFLTMEENQTEM